VLIDRPAARLAAPRTAACSSPRRARVVPRGPRPAPLRAAGEPERYDRVSSTLPNDVFEQVADPGLLPDSSWAAALDRVLRGAVPAARARPPFSPYYWTNVADRELPFVGLIEHTNFVEPERYGGRRFLYVANYLQQGHELLTLDADELIDRYEPGLRKVNPAFDRSWVRERWLFREPAAQPIVNVGYRERIPPLRTPVEGLVLANTTQVYPEDRGTNYAVRLGGEAAEALLR
jgi:protoporphyrinogen oxidase